jgi:exopolyphosphatase / guanosine-5'-triphosphate,3'-diphosphate pyrophosphatase
LVLPGNFAAIDLGSNTFHLIIFKDTGVEPQLIFKMRKAVGIGKDGLEKNSINPKALQRGIEALMEFKQYTTEHSCKKIVVTATSAFRNAQNKAEVLEEIKNKTGFDVQIISGEEEAHLIYEGVKKSVQFDETNGLIMDIGGGSVEFIICNENELLWKESFEIGGIRLMEKFHLEDPISDKNSENLLKYLQEKLQSLYIATEKYKPSYLIGASGTFDTLCEIRNERVEVEDPNHLSLDEYAEISKEIISKNYFDRLKIEGMIAMRAEMISVACLLIQEVMDKCNLQFIQCSKYALKEGLMYRIVKNIKIN